MAKKKSQKLYRLLLSVIAFCGLSNAATLWSTSFEDGTINAFYLPGTSATDPRHGGGAYSSGSAWNTVTNAFAHNGTRSLELSISTPSTPTSGMRMFRWKESQSIQTLSYTAWFYFTQNETLTYPPAHQFLNIMNWKSKDPTDQKVKTFASLLLYNHGSGGNLQLSVSNNHGDTQLGPVTTYNQASPGQDWPIGRWVKIQAIHRCSTTDGRIIVYMDGFKLFDLALGQNSFANIGASGCQWATQLYSNGLVPNPTVVYIDDLSIDTL